MRPFQRSTFVLRFCKGWAVVMMSDPMTDGLEVVEPISHDFGLNLLNEHLLKRTPVMTCTGGGDETYTVPRSYDVCAGFTLRIRIPHNVAPDVRDRILCDVMNTDTSVQNAGFSSNSSVKRAAWLLDQLCGFRTLDPRIDGGVSGRQFIARALGPLASHCSDNGAYISNSSFPITEAETDMEDFMLDVPLLLNLVHPGRVVFPYMSMWYSVATTFHWPSSVAVAVASQELFLTVGAHDSCLCESRLRSMLLECNALTGISVRNRMWRWSMLAGDTTFHTSLFEVESMATYLTLTGRHRKPPDVTCVTGTLNYQESSCDVELVATADNDMYSTTYQLLHSLSGLCYITVTCNVPTEEVVIVEVNTMAVVRITGMEGLFYCANHHDGELPDMFGVEWQNKSGS